MPAADPRTDPLVTDDSERFWEHTPMERMTRAQWESLCDGCGRCCLHKLEDVDTGQLLYTRVACRLLDSRTGRCGDYANRTHRVSDCLVLDPDNVRAYQWLPHTCAYRRLAEGRPLPAWHPLLTGDPDSVRRAGVSVTRRTVSESDVPFEEWEEYVVEWEPHLAGGGQ